MYNKVLLGIISIMVSINSIQKNEWQKIDFINYDSSSPLHEKKNPHYIKPNENPFVILGNEKYIIQQKLIKLLSNDTIFHYNNLSLIEKLFKNTSYVHSQLDADFYRQNYTINNHNVSHKNYFINYIDFSISNIYYKKIIFSCCTQAIMSIPLIAISNYFDLEQYVLGEIDSEIEDKSMYIHVEIENEEWNVHIQKPLRIFDTFGTLYCILLDIDVDENGFVVSIKPFL